MSGSNNPIIWNLADGCAKLEGHAWLPHRRLASGSENGRIRLWNLADGKLLTKLEGHTAGVLRLSSPCDRARAPRAFRSAASAEGQRTVPGRARRVGQW